MKNKGAIEMELQINKERHFSRAEKDRLLNAAVANMEMEGFVFSAEDKKTIMDLFDNRISVDQVVERLQKNL